MQLFEHLAKFHPENPEVAYYYGVTLLAQHRLDQGITEFEHAIKLDPNYNLPYYAAYLALWERGDKERSLTYLQRWVDRHPDDAQAAQLLAARRGTRPGVSAPPMPQLPGLP